MAAIEQNTKIHRILLVDDEYGVLQALQRVLKNSSYELEAFIDPSQAIARARAAKFDLIVTDYRMPGINGVTLIKEIKRTQPDVMCIMLSGFTHLGAVLEAINEAEIFRYITKPWDDDELRIVVATALARHEPDKGKRSTQLKSMQEFDDKQHVNQGAMYLLEQRNPGITKGRWDSVTDAKKWRLTE